MNAFTLNLHQTAVAVAACARAGRVALVLGPPGVGKTSLARAIAPTVGRALGYTNDNYPSAVCILSNREAVDIGGYPVVLSNDTVEQRLFGTLSQAARDPHFLILDEFLTCSQSVQGPALRLTLERFAGEQPLHEDTRVACFANPPDQAPGGIQLTAALVNRLVVIHCRPLVSEVAAFFCGRPDASLTLDLSLPDLETWEFRKRLLMDTAGILFESRTDLLCFDPPEASISGGEPFASPRAWEICCDVLAALPQAHLDSTSEVCRAVVMGILGPSAGISYLGILRARNHLPTVQDVIKHPDTAKIPDTTTPIPDPDKPDRKIPIGKDVNFAAIPLIIEASRVDVWASWVYTARLPDEIKAAIAKKLTTYMISPPDSPWQVRGRQIMLETVGRMTAPAASTSTPTQGKRKAS